MSHRCILAAYIGVYCCVRIISPANGPVNRTRRCIGDTRLRAIRTIDHVILLCADLEEMKHFYHEVLFFKDPEGNILEIYADIDAKSSEREE